MPINKDQLLRIEILDELLSRKKWSKQELIDRINDRIIDHHKPIGERTFYRDVNYLVDEKAAPIHRPTKGDALYYYTEKFSLKETPFDAEEIDSLKKAVQFLKLINNSKILSEVEAIIRKLENRIHINEAALETIVLFEDHTISAGQEHINELMDAIQLKSPVEVKYQSFNQDKPILKIIHPYLLKEYRNRWFLFARVTEETRLSIFALDRIRQIKVSSIDFTENDLIDSSSYFSYLIGVSIPKDAVPEKIILRISDKTAPYILSKPIHKNQEVLKRYANGSIKVMLNLIVNYELKSILLGYGSGVEILEPDSLRKKIKEELKETITKYM